MNLIEASTYAEKILGCKWVKWIHRGTNPAKTAQEKNLNVIRSAINPKHCAICLNMNGCCFVKNNCPENPFHYNCHCYYENIDMVTTQTTSTIDKFTNYLFSATLSKGKKDLFEKWGYSVSDSFSLKEEFEKQAQLAYQSGDYKLGEQTVHGQRINIAIRLKRKNSQQYVLFKTGWMTYPNGKLQLITPYGGKIE